MNDSASRPRLRIHPVTKRHAPPEIRALLDEVQDGLGIPWAPANWRAFALFPEVMALFWQRLEPLVRLPGFRTEALGITRAAYADAERWFRPAKAIDLTTSDQRALQWEIDAFEFGNPQVFLQQLLLADALLVGANGSGLPRLSASTSSEELSESPYRHPEVQLVEEPSAPENVRRVYADIQRTLGVELVNTDYLAFAKWPEFFEGAWEEVKRALATPAFEELTRRIEGMGRAAAERLPALEPISAEALEDALGPEEDADYLLAMVRAFTALIPELIAIDALFRVQAKRARVSDLGPEWAEPARARGEQQR